MRSPWVWALLVVLLGLVVLDAVSDGRPASAVGYGVVALAVAWWTSPWRGRGGPTHEEVLTMTGTDAPPPVVIYWRPGCGFCAMLKARLGSLRDRATWINIWEDEQGAAFVREVNGGNETVPTVVIDGVPHTNPSPKLVIERLKQRHDR
ncbi:glutaredoxin domain-containing protein [Ornithinimicrobium sp. W1679]|uniref:glutaredoxin domain-containing protein n=1 Tax=Ornithinimicrobium sp. W1679 TaxID=3418770 RepID=UPI003CF8BD33